MQANDLVVMGSMVDAIFDGGYYSQILVQAIDGDALIEKSVPVKIEGVPTWFVGAVGVAASSSQCFGHVRLESSRHNLCTKSSGVCV